MTREEAKKKINGINDVQSIVVDKLIDKIYDDFESRTCEGCKYFNGTIEEDTDIPCYIECDMFYIETREAVSVKDFSCNNWEDKHLLGGCDE